MSLSHLSRFRQTLDAVEKSGHLDTPTAKKLIADADQVGRNETYVAKAMLKQLRYCDELEMDSGVARAIRQYANRQGVQSAYGEHQLWRTKGLEQEVLADEVVTADEVKLLDAMLSGFRSPNWKDNWVPLAYLRTTVELNRDRIAPDAIEPLYRLLNIPLADPKKKLAEIESDGITAVEMRALINEVKTDHGQFHRPVTSCEDPLLLDVHRHGQDLLEPEASALLADFVGADPNSVRFDFGSLYPLRAVWEGFGVVDRVLPRHVHELIRMARQGERISVKAKHALELLVALYSDRFQPAALTTLERYLETTPVGGTDHAFWSKLSGRVTELFPDSELPRREAKRVEVTLPGRSLAMEQLLTGMTIRDVGAQAELGEGCSNYLTMNASPILNGRRIRTWQAFLRKVDNTPQFELTITGRVPGDTPRVGDTQGFVCSTKLTPAQLMGGGTFVCESPA